MSLRLSTTLRLPPVLRLSALAVLLSLLLAIAPARAQFTGPAPNAGYGVNYPTQVTTDQGLLFPPDRDILLDAGDVVRISVYGTSDYLFTDRIAIDGTIRLPLVGSVHLAGLSRHEAQVLIAQKLLDAGIFQDPQVLLEVTESPNLTATFIGELHGTVPLTGRKRLLDAIAAAGGLPGTASHLIVIHRPGLNQPIVVDLGNNPYTSQFSNVPVFPGDTIETGSVGRVFLWGPVRAPGPQLLSGIVPLTLTQAIIVGGGPLFEAKLERTYVVRTIGTRRTVLTFDTRRIRDGKDPDPALQNDDVIIIPTDNLRLLIKSVGVGTVIGVALTFISLYR